MVLYVGFTFSDICFSSSSSLRNSTSASLSFSAADLGIVYFVVTNFLSLSAQCSLLAFKEDDTSFLAFDLLLSSSSLI